MDGLAKAEVARAKAKAPAAAKEAVAGRKRQRTKEALPPAAKAEDPVLQLRRKI